MSWFSRSFPAPFRPKDQNEHEVDQREISEAHEDELWASSSSVVASRPGVKEDLSELTKSFTRQLWGVASFLAPPPQNKSRPALESDTSPLSVMNSDSGSHSQGVSQLPVPSVESTAEHFPIDGLGRVNASVDTSAGEFSPNLLTQTHEETVAEVSTVAPKSHWGSGQIFTGVRSDLAELKGSVATGISRIIKVVREEIEKEELERFPNDPMTQSEDEMIDGSESSADPQKLPRFDSLLRPLFGSVLSADRNADENIDGSVVVEQHSGEVAKPSSRIQGRKTMGLSSRLVGGLDGISKLASTLFPPNLDSDEEDPHKSEQSTQAVGLTEEVIDFARNISFHPETWFGFPLFSDDEESADFEMSNVQQEHAVAVELGAPRLAALRNELCPGYMTEGRFWKIYFVLLHSRLSKKDALLLSTPQIIDARALLLKELQKRELHAGKSVSSLEGEGQDIGRDRQREDTSKDLTSGSNQRLAIPESYKVVSLQAATEVPPTDFQQNEDHEGGTAVNRLSKSALAIEVGDDIQNKDVLASTVKFAALKYEEEEAEVDEWLEEEPSSNVGTSTGLGNDDDLSFSDLEEEDETNAHSVVSKVTETAFPRKSQGWVQLNRSSSPEESREVSKYETSEANCIKKGELNRNNLPHSDPVEQTVKKPDKGESSDWSTVDEDDVASADSL